MALTINAPTAVTESALDPKQLSRLVVQVFGGFLLALVRAGLPSGALTSTEDVTPANAGASAGTAAAMVVAGWAGFAYSILVEQLPYFGNLRVRSTVVVAVVCSLVVMVVLAVQLGLLVVGSVPY